MRSLIALLSVLAVLAKGPAELHEASVGRLEACPEELTGAWTGTLDLQRLFTIRLTIREAGEDGLVATIGWADGVEEVPTWRQADRFRFQAGSRPIAFDVERADDGTGLDAFVQYGDHVAHVRIPRRADGSWSLDWSYLEVEDDRARLDLYVEDEGDGRTGGYFFFRDPRLPALYGEGVTCEGGVVTIRERNLAMRLEGSYVGGDSLRLVVSSLAGEAPVAFKRMSPGEIPESPDASLVPPRSPDRARYAERAPREVDDGWDTAKPSEEGVGPGVVARLVESIVDRELPGIHAVLVARHGRLVVEEYFYGFDRDTPHDLRSASKTFASSLIGLAIREGAIENASTPALARLPYRRYANWDPRKARITLRDLMTMSSGLDADDDDPDSPAAERSYQARRAHADWVKTALDAPMIADPGARPLYGGANPLILGGVLESVLDEPVEWFAHRTLFGPLGISDYRWFTRPTGGPYLAGGMHLRPRAVLKIGQLYLDGGVWRGERILPRRWIRDSWASYGRLAPLDVNGHEYGYLWWHHAYEVGGRLVRTREARGYGGQYLFVVPKLDLVAVVTAGNYRNGKTRLSEDVLARLLPAVR